MKISIDLTDKDLNSLSLKSRLHDLSSQIKIYIYVNKRLGIGY